MSSRARSQSSNDAEPPAKRSRKQSDHTASELNNHLAESACDPPSDHYDNQPASNAITLLTYPFLLPLVVDYLCDRDVIARLLIVNKSIRLLIPKYAIKKMLITHEALRVIRSIRDITFSVTRVQTSFGNIKQLIEVHQENSRPLKEAHCTLKMGPIASGPTFVIPPFVTHLTYHFRDKGIRVPVGSIPNAVVELDLKYYVPVIGSIPSSVKRLSMNITLSEFDPAVIPSTVTDLRLSQCDTPADLCQEIRWMFPSSLTHLDLGSYKLPIALGVIPSSLVKLGCTSKLLSRLEVGAIPDSVKEMKIDWDMRYAPKVGVIPDSVTHIDMSEHFRYARTNIFPRWPMPARLTHVKMMTTIGKLRLPAGIVPSTVTHFRFDFAAEPGALPDSITHLTMLNLELVVGVIPHSVTHLSLPCWDVQPSMITPGIIPSSVTHLDFSCNDNQKMVPGIIPDSVTHLTFDSMFNRPVPDGEIPQSVTHLVFGERFNQSLTRHSLPRALTHLVFGSEFDKPLAPGVVPPSVKRLVFDGSFSCVAGDDIIPCVTHLSIAESSSFDHKLHPGNFPRSLTHLELPASYLRNEDLHLPASVTHLSYKPVAIYERPEFQSNFFC